jgi:hypothetical protein
MDLIEPLRQRIETGDREGAKREVAAILRADPRNVPAWMLLAALIEDPARQADCYRQVLRLDPANRTFTPRNQATWQGCCACWGCRSQACKRPPTPETSAHSQDSSARTT